VAKFAETFNNDMALNNALKLAEADIAYRDAAKMFDNGNFQDCLDLFFKAIHLRYDIEKPEIKRLIRKKLDTINEKGREIQRLKKLIDEQNKLLRKKESMLAELAKEYVQMGQECINLNSFDAALANFDKALKLNSINTDARIGKARILLSQSKLRKALAEVNKALDISPALFKALYWKAKVLFKMQNTEDAISILGRCTSLKPNNINVHLLYGDVLSAAGDDNNAAIHYAIAEQLKKQKQEE
jgi:tetratricopeptide (TPR) repeat protein